MAEVAATGGEVPAEQRAVPEADTAVDEEVPRVEPSKEEGGAAVRPGVAAIKPQYIIPKRDGPEGPPPAKKKKRGQNKHRPRPKVPCSEQLCPTFHLHSDTTCQFGDTCRYMHDIAKFMSAKPPDLGEACYIFETYGQCPYGAACRFAGAHLTPEFVNVVDLERFDSKRVSSTVNVLSKSLQEKLRKKSMEFPRSDAYFKQLQLRGPNSKESSLVSIASAASTPELEKAAEQHPNTPPVANSHGNVQPSSAEGPCKDCFSKLPGGPATVEGKAMAVELAGKGCAVCGAADEARTGGGLPSQSRGPLCDVDMKSEKKKIDFRGKLYLAPLTTVGNLPFRRICKGFGADITCGEMAMSVNLLQGQQSEWALLKRHESEEVFGVQVCGSHADSMTRCAELISTHASVDFVDINVGCPIDLVFKKGSGCALMGRHSRFESIVRAMSSVLDCPLTVKMRTGVYNKNWNAHLLIPKLRDWGVSLVTLHGRSREQRYTRLADWDYINSCAQAADPMPLFGNGDILSFEDYNLHQEKTQVAGTMIARGALIKPWIFTEIKEQRHWDISSGERLDILRRYVNYGLEHWGSDSQGVENTRKFLLEWLSFLYRYIPVGILERLPQRINERPPYYCGRDDLETLLASNNCQDWVRISEMLLGPVPSNFQFAPKHRANAYS